MAAAIVLQNVEGHVLLLVTYALPYLSFFIFPLLFIFIFYFYFTYRIYLTVEGSLREQSRVRVGLLNFNVLSPWPALPPLSLIFSLSLSLFIFSLFYFIRF